MFVSDMTTGTDTLRSHSTNAKYAVNGVFIKDDQVIELKDNDEYEVHFLKESGNISAGLIEGAVAYKTYHSLDSIKYLAGKHGFDIKIGDYKTFGYTDVGIDLTVIIMEKL